MSTGTGEREETAPADWRGSSRAARRRPVEHRWQEDRREGRAAERSHSRMLLYGLGLLGLLVAMLGLFVWGTSFRPVRTPLIAIAAPTYPDPFPPNAWSREDLDSLATLHCETVDFFDLSTAWQTGGVGLRALENELRNVAPAARRSGATIVYLSMHGAVDGEGRPCLIPPAASPVNDRSWLPVTDVLERLESFAAKEQTNVLLVLDTTRIAVDWNLGILANAFVRRLEETLEEKPPSRVAVLTASGAGEVGWSSPEMQGSVFGTFFQEGLAGRADERDFGNGDGRVSIHELHEYTARKCDAWARRNRGCSQSPQLLPGPAEDHVVAWATSRGSRRTWAARIEDSPTTEVLSQAEIDGLWGAFECVSSAVADRIDPVTWGSVRRRLRRAERAAHSGRDYAEVARREYADLMVLLDNAAKTCQEANAADQEKDPAAKGPSSPEAEPAADTTSLLTEFSTGLSLEEEWTLFGTEGDTFPRGLSAHTLALAERLGTIDRTKARRARTLLEAYESDGGDLAALDKQLQDTLGTNQYAETFFPRLLAFSSVERPWRYPVVFETRRLAETLAAPRDERTVGWVRPAQQAADELRRTAEDELLAGSFQEDEWSKVATAYQGVAKREHGAHRALADLDRAAATLPWLAAWAASPERLVDADRKTVEAVVEDLRDLTDDLVKLRRLVGASEEASTGEALQFLDLAARVESALDARTKTLSDEYGRLEKQIDLLSTIESPTAEQVGQLTTTLAALEGVLAVPLLPQAEPGTSPSARRGRLRRGAATLRTLLIEKSGTIPIADLPEPRPNLVAYQKRVDTLWNFHPAEVVLQPLDASAADGAKGSEADRGMGGEGGLTGWVAGARVRDRLRNVPDLLQSSTTGAAATLDESRRLITRGCDIVRTAAPFAFPDLDDDPIAQLRFFDLRQLLLWNGERALDDFYGPAGTGADSFFAGAVQRYVADLGHVVNASPLMHEAAQRFSDRLAARRKAAASGVEVAATDVVVLDPKAGADVSIVVTTTEVAAAGGLPSGVAVVEVANDDGVIKSTARPLALPATKSDEPFRKELTQPLALAATNGKPLLRAEALFRGHRYANDFLFEPVDGSSTVYVPKEFDTSSVELNGPRQRPLRVLFVLDCSNSMREPSDLESRDEKRPTKLDVARIALGNMFDELVATGNVQVGLVLFGHRAGWEPEKKGRLHFQEKYARIDQAPPTLKPYEDVEIVLPAGRFDQAIADSMGDLLATVEPWGESPLYLAVKRGAESLEAAGGDAEPVVIVLTDGLDNQFAPPPSAKVDLANVVQALRGTGVRVNVIGFGIPESERRQAETEFKTLGQYDVSPAKAPELLESIRRGLGPQKYTVDSVDVPLGTAHEVKLLKAEPGTASPTRPVLTGVAFGSRSTELELWGGEQVELEISRDGRLIVPAPQDTGTRVSLVPPPGAGPDEPSRSVQVTSPVHEDGAVRFEFTILRDDRAFSKRPRVLRFEVVPVDERGRTLSARYVFSDPAFVPGRSHPRLEYVATRWPKEGVRAEIDCWMSFEETKPQDQITVDLGGTPQIGRDRQVISQPGMTYRISTTALERRQLDVYERVTGPNGRLGDLTFAVQPIDAIARIVRQFDDRHGIVTHTFVLAGEEGANEPKLTLDVRSRSALRQRASRFAKPVVVDVVEPTDTVLPTVPHGSP